MHLIVIFLRQHRRVFAHVTGPRTATKKQRNADARRTYCFRSVDVPGQKRSLLTRRTSVQKSTQPPGNRFVSESAARTPDGSGHK